MAEPSRQRAAEYQPDTDQSLDVSYGNSAPIETYIADRAAREPFIASDTPSTLPPSQLASIEAVFGPPKVSAEEFSKRGNRQRRVWKRIKGELIREELVALGWRQKDADGFPIIERITKRFWVAAHLREGWNLAKEYETNQTFNDVRIVEVGSIVATHLPISAEVQPATAAPDFSKMSKEEIRAYAIDGCASPNRPEWFQKGKKDRRIGYFEYLKKRGLNVQGGYGYGEDSWEADEQKYKEVHGLKKPKSPNRW